ncbi:MAG TPA: DUF5668 domain-containing protein [Verrucomicrobiae bacterium]|nr:DUF5668 domain-containing protein [Verrucomicrobiae bacterium]
MAQKRNSDKNDSLVWGIILVALGVIFLLQELFNIEIFSQIWQFWPVALIVFGVILIVNNRRS